MSKIVLTEQTSVPATPSSGKVRIFVNAAGTLASVDDVGTLTTYGAGVTQEQVEDYVGSLLQDTSTVNVTYNDVGNAITLDVIAGGVNHNALLNYVANRHVDHSAVSITAGTGLSGGGDLTATRTISMPSVGTAGTYKSVTTDAQGRVTAGTNPTTLSGYGITDAQPIDSDLTALSALAGTGVVVRTGTGTATTRNIAAGSGISVSNGDGISGNPTVTLSLPAVGSAGTYGSASSVSVITTDAQGRVSSAVSTAISITSSAVTNFASSVIGSALTGFTAAAGTVAATDTVLQAFQKIQGTLTDGLTTFGSSVINSVITGFSVGANATIAASDTILQAFGKTQGQIDQINADAAVWNELITTTDSIVNSNTTLTSVPSLAFTATAGSTYYLEYTVRFRTAANGTGFTFSIGTPNTAVGSLAMQINLPVAADGTASLYTGALLALADTVTSTGVASTNPDWYILNAKGSFICTTSGTVQPYFRSEVNGSNVNFGTGSIALIREF